MICYLIVLVVIEKLSRGKHEMRVNWIWNGQKKRGNLSRTPFD